MALQKIRLSTRCFCINAYMHDELVSKCLKHIKMSHFPVDYCQIWLLIVRTDVAEIVFDAHRSAKTGLAFLRARAAQHAGAFRACAAQGSDVFGALLVGVPRATVTGGVGGASLGALTSFSTGTSSVSSDYCVCPECRQTTAACRFAPHLEKCMGMGRNSSRLARRRLATACASSSSLSSLGWVAACCCPCPTRVMVVTFQAACSARVASTTTSGRHPRRNFARQPEARGHPCRLEASRRAGAGCGCGSATTTTGRSRRWPAPG